MAAPEDILSAIDAHLAGARRVLITAHSGPDGDSLGSQLGLAGFLRPRTVCCDIVDEGVIPHNYMFLPGIKTINNVRSFTPPAHAYDTVIFVECSNRNRIGDVERLIGATSTIINIDHHQDNTRFGHFNFIDHSASSAGEMVYSFLEHCRADISVEMATNLFTAILTDTGRFHYGSTTPRSLRISANLIEKGANTVTITENVYYNLTTGSIKLTGRALLSLEYFCHNRVCFMTISQEMLRENGASKADLEGMANYTLIPEGVVIGVMFTELSPSAVKVSFRSQNSYNVAAVAAGHGGGGHINAAGCNLAVPLAEAKRIILNHLEEVLHGRA